MPVPQVKEKPSQIAKGNVEGKASGPDISRATVGIIGLGYVGLPLAEGFAKSLKVIGFDVKSDKVAELTRSNRQPNMAFTDNAKDLSRADFHIICVPTPVTAFKEPDLGFITRAAETVGQNMKKNSIVVLESTVYPGVTEEIVAPILEKNSGLKCGPDFKVGYAPERVNPGDKEHTVDRVIKVVSGMDDETAALVAALYSRITPHVFKARDIKTAEAAKVIENIQRDLNIALMNELSIIFDKLNLDTQAVLDAACTKWNFHRYSPGLVGGHCIPVDPYYLVYKANHVAEMTIKALNSSDKVIKGSRILIMGLTYKENVADTRETPVKEVIKELREYSVDVYGYDPLLDVAEAEKEFDIPMIKKLESGIEFDGIILAVAHEAFKENGGGISIDRLETITKPCPVLIDVKRCLDGNEASEKGFYYRTL
jgi:UDP-N-acetyl-D-galactosamine dehydrogenase